MQTADKTWTHKLGEVAKKSEKGRILNTPACSGLYYMLWGGGGGPRNTSQTS